MQPSSLRALCVLLVLVCIPGSAAVPGATGRTAPVYSCAFTPAAWKRADWIPVKNPRSEHFGGWVQRPDCIVNETPAGATPDELQGKRSAECYSSMVYKEKLKGNVTITAAMSFEHKMAPLIVLAPDVPENAQGQKEYAEHFEIVIFNEGVNVWHHFLKDGKLTYRKAAFATFPLEKETKYTLQVKKTGKTLTVSVAGHSFGYIEDALPDSLYVGITGCEGVNRFYDFACGDEAVRTATHLLSPRRPSIASPKLISPSEDRTPPVAGRSPANRRHPPN